MAGNAVEQHYTRGDLQSAVLAAIVDAGYDPDALDPDALTPAEEFHTFGRAATVALADAAAITADDRVLDVGSGLGGPARHLARQYGCSVVGVDLTAELCDVAATSPAGSGSTSRWRSGRVRRWSFRSATASSTWSGPSTSR